MSDPLPASTDVAIVGGGIMGTFLAWHLTRRGVRNVTVFERKTVASGASGKTGALLRQHYSNPTEAKLAYYGVEIFRHWRDHFGDDCGFVQSGIILTFPAGATAAENIERLKRNVEMQRSLGIDSHALSPADLKALQPFVRVDDLAGAAYEPNGGYVDAVAATRSAAAAAVRGGARIVENCGVEAIASDGDRIIGVRTPAGVVSTDTVVVAGGAASVALLATAGIDVPVEALRVQVAIVHRPLDLDQPHAAFIDIAAGMFCRPWAPGRTLVGISGRDQYDPVDPIDYDERNDAGYPTRAIAAVSRRIPAMVGAAYLDGRAGLYDMTPDTHPILGASGIDGLSLMLGFSGAGFKKAPAVAQCLAELLVDGHAKLVDLAPFRLDRFADDSWQQPWSDTEYVLTSDFGHRF